MIFLEKNSGLMLINIYIINPKVPFIVDVKKGVALINIKGVYYG